MNIQQQPFPVSKNMYAHTSMTSDIDTDSEPYIVVEWFPYLFDRQPCEGDKGPIKQRCPADYALVAYQRALDLNIFVGIVKSLFDHTAMRSLSPKHIRLQHIIKEGSQPAWAVVSHSDWPKLLVEGATVGVFIPREGA